MCVFVCQSARCYYFYCMNQMIKNNNGNKKTRDDDQTHQIIRINSRLLQNWIVCAWMVYGYPEISEQPPTLQTNFILSILFFFHLFLKRIVWVCVCLYCEYRWVNHMVWLEGKTVNGKLFIFAPSHTLAPLLLLLLLLLSILYYVYTERKRFRLFSSTVFVCDVCLQCVQVCVYYVWRREFFSPHSMHTTRWRNI